jgi:hypothetical protein
VGQTIGFCRLFPMGEDRATAAMKIREARRYRGRYGSGDVETVRLFDPGRFWNGKCAPGFSPAGGEGSTREWI